MSGVASGFRGIVGGGNACGRFRPHDVSPSQRDDRSSDILHGRDKELFQKEKWQNLIPPVTLVPAWVPAWRPGLFIDW